ncbi:MAG: ROK family protein [Actinomycetota bacterium]|nr:ROK family protein [Actinomycetota bacterium]
MAFDLGGTRLKAALVDPANADVSGFFTAPVGSTIAEGIAEIESVGKRILDGSSCEGVGLCVPGLVDDQGIIASLPGKFEGAEGFDLPGSMRLAFDCEPVIVNDAVAFGVGESVHGAGRGFRSVTVVTIGTGVGVTAVSDGLPIGAGLYPGGILAGHIPVSERTSGPIDTNGTHDTIEALCRATRLVDYANDAGGSFEDVAAVYAAHDKRDVSARAGVDRYRSLLAHSLVAIAHAFAPEAIVLGGGPMTKDNPVIQGIEETVNSRLFGSYRTRILISQLGDTAALVGLGSLWRKRFSR